MSIADKIQRLQAAKTAIATAITNKGGTVASGDGYEDFATDIATIPSGGGGTDNLPAFISDGVSTFTDNNITKIGAYAFYYRNSSNVTTPITSVSCANVENIGNYAFQSCAQLTSVDFPKCKTLGQGSFSSSGLTSFITTDNLISIGQNVFNNCQSLTSFTVPKNVTTIANSAFNNCKYITTFNYNAKTVSDFSSSSNNVFAYLGTNTSGVTFTIGDTVEDIPAYFLYPNSASSYAPKITTLNFPLNNNIKSIGENAFRNCRVITGALSFPAITTLTKSMQYAFGGCTNLTSLSLSNLSSLGGGLANGMNSVCYGCTSLTSVDLSSLAELHQSYILRYAFRNCTSLTTLSFPSLNSTSFGNNINQFNNMLQGVTGCTVHFPSNLQSVIGSWADVTAGFGGTNTTVLFDLTATT